MAGGMAGGWNGVGRRILTLIPPVEVGGGEEQTLIQASTQNFSAGLIFAAVP